MTNHHSETSQLVYAKVAGLVYSLIVTLGLLNMVVLEIYFAHIP